MPKSKIQDKNDFLRTLASSLRSTASRPNIYGYNPHDKQIDFHCNTGRGKLFIGGNRSGKTVGGATEAVWRCLGKHPYRSVPEPPVFGRCVSVDFLNGVQKIVKPEIARWVPMSELKGGSWESAYNKEERTLRFENGSILEFMSYDQDLDEFAGTSRHFIWFDEEPPQDIFTECKMRLLDTGGDWWITMTPVDGMTWVYDDIYLAARTDPLLFVVEVDTTQNHYINPGEIEVILSGLSEDEKKARLHGQFVQRGGLIYPNFSIRNIIDFTLPDSNMLCFNAMDAGINNPTAWLWMACDIEGRILIYNEHYEAGKVVAYHAAKVLEMNSQMGVTPTYNVGDPSIGATSSITGTSVHMEYMEHGVPILLGNNDVMAGINIIRTKIGLPDDKTSRPNLYITKNCVNLLYEIQRYRWASWATKRHNFEKNKKEEPHKKDDHACDALRYGVASRPQVEDLSLPADIIKPPTGIAQGIDPSIGLRDNGLLNPTSQVYVDSVLGSEW